MATRDPLRANLITRSRSFQGFEPSLKLLLFVLQLEPTDDELKSILKELLGSYEVPFPHYQWISYTRSAFSYNPEYTWASTQTEWMPAILASLKDFKGKKGWIDYMLIDFLKRPECLDEWQATVIELLGTTTGKDFQGDIWEVAGNPVFADAVKRPMKRPDWLSQ
jgi:hypothetical protein